MTVIAGDARRCCTSSNKDGLALSDPYPRAQPQSGSASASSPGVLADRIHMLVVIFPGFTGAGG
jgi:hypothetical protein